MVRSFIHRVAMEKKSVSMTERLKEALAEEVLRRSHAVLQLLRFICLP